MKKVEVISKIMDYGILTAIKAGSRNEASKIIDAVIKGGIKVIEISMTVPNAIDIIEQLSRDNIDGIIVGAGNVLDPKMAQGCIMAGAQFIATPKMDSDIIKLCNRYNVAVIPMTLGINQIITALESGADIVKISPDETIEADIVTSVNAILPQANIIPMGNITIDNLDKWVEAGAAAIGIESEQLKNSKKINYAEVERTAAKFVDKLSM